MKQVGFGVVVAGLLAGCAQPNGPTTQAAQPAGATTAAASSPGPAGPGRKATTCQVAGFAWQQRSAHIAPTMTVSSNGWCNAGARAYGSQAMGITPATQPQHGRLTTSDPGQNPYLRYYPTPGYEGPDSFTINTGQAGQVTADFAVTVVK